MVYLRKNSKSLLNILPPLFMFDDKDFTQAMIDIYKKCDTYSIKINMEKL